MADELSAKQPADPGQVNLHEEWELAYWMKLLGADESNLRSAVQEVGANTDAVRTHLGKRQTQS